MFERILIATDFGAHSQMALHVVRQHFTSAQRRLVHVARSVGAAEDIDADLLSEKLIARDREELNALVQPSESAVVITGDPAMAIVTAAKEWRADLIALGARESSGFGARALGSVAEGVMACAPVPVLVLKAAPGADHLSTGESLTSVLIPVDFSPCSGLALQVARQHFPTAQRTLLHVIDKRPLRTGRAVGLVNASTHWKHEATLAGEKLNGLLAPGETAKVVIGVPAQDITATASQIDARLIVMGTHGRRGVARAMYGSVAQEVAQSGAVPVMTVHVVAAREHVTAVPTSVSSAPVERKQP